MAFDYITRDTDFLQTFMTRIKYSYQWLILTPKFIEHQKTFRSIATTMNEFLAICEKEEPMFRDRDRRDAPMWVPWPYGPAMTHNADGSITQELRDWLKANERQIEIAGYAEIGEPVNVWNPQVRSWVFDKHGEFNFSPAYWEYLLSEGYVKRWIECEESRMSSDLQSLSNSFPTEYIQQRIMETEIPHRDRRDHLGYNPLSGLMSEHKIYQWQVDTRENPERTKRLMVAEAAK